MKFEEKNVVLSEVLSKEEMDLIRDQVNNTSYNQYTMELFSQNVYDFELPESVRLKVIDYCQRISGESDLEIAEYQFARYQNTEVDGKVLKPNLFPHRDSFAEPRFTFDYQIGGNTTWPLVVEGEEFTLFNNDALTFSGTHQVHWRVPKTFTNDEYIEMVFFHLRKKGAKPYPSEVVDIVQEKVNKFMKDYEGEKNV